MVASNSAWSLKTNLRKLWADHVIWTREYLVAAIAATQDAQVAAGRLLKNQEHLGNAIVPYYGQAAGDRLTALLKQHILIAVDLVAAAKAGQQDQFQQHDQRWTQNARDIADFLAGANPNWPAQDVADLLNVHLTLTKKEAVARLTEHWEEDIAAFDDIFTEIMTVSDTLSDGIIQQFPAKF